MLDLFRRLARYNAWANARLYEACAQLPEAEYLRERPAFFGSIHGTLSHILIGDRIWLARIRGEPAPHARLDERPYPDLAGLCAAREAEDAGIVALVEGLDETGLARTVSYRNSTGEAFTNRLGDVLPHVFNHQTHHRGQVHDQLSHTRVAPPALDLILFLRTRER